MEPRVHRNEVDLLSRALAWQADGERVVLATVAHTWGSSPRQPGAVMVLSESGLFEGSVSGGCIEEELIARVRDDFPARVETIEYASDTHRSLPCGGRLLLVLEPLAAAGDVPGLIDALRSGRRVVRTIGVGGRPAAWRLAGSEDATAFDGERLEVVYEPAWRLVVVGAGELATWVCRFADALEYAIEVCDPRAEYRDAWPLAGVTVAAAHPDDHIAAADCNAQTAIVALTHDPKIDDLAMIEALGTPAFYIGALGSARTAGKRAARLAEHFDVPDEQLARIRGPIGLDLNTRKPQEIALAVMVEITAARNGVELGSRRIEG